MGLDPLTIPGALGLWKVPFKHSKLVLLQWIKYGIVLGTNAIPFPNNLESANFSETLYDLSSARQLISWKTQCESF